MFANSYQSGFISIFYSVGSNPLALWDKQVKNGHIRRIVDDEVRSLVLDISGANVSTTYITCPIKPRASLGIRLPFFVMIIKNMKKYFTFEIQILDDKEMHRRFRVSNFQSSTKVKPFCTTMPIGLSSGWNQVQFNLADFTKRAYGSTYRETMRVQIHANVRVRRLYFTDTLYTDEELPNEFKLFGPLSKKKEPEKKSSKDEVCEQKPPEEVPPPPSPVDTTVVEETEPKPLPEAAGNEDATADQVETEVATIEGDAVEVVVEGASSDFEEEGETEEEGDIEEGVELVSGAAPEEAAIAEEAEAAEGAEGAPESGEAPEAPQDEVPAEETPIEALAQAAEPPAETTETEAAEPPVEAAEPPAEEAEPAAAEEAVAEAPPAE